MQVIQICEKKRKPQPKYILVDTPGQIEIFTWSASGAIITEAFASTFPTMVAYVVDTARSASPQTFMSNMLQAIPSSRLSGADARKVERCGCLVSHATMYGRRWVAYIPGSVANASEQHRNACGG